MYSVQIQITYITILLYIFYEIYRLKTNIDFFITNSKLVVYIAIQLSKKSYMYCDDGKCVLYFFLAVIKVLKWLYKHKTEAKILII